MLNKELDRISSGLEKEDDKTAVDKIELSYPAGTPISNSGYGDLPSPRTYMLGNRSKSERFIRSAGTFKERVDMMK